MLLLLLLPLLMGTSTQGADTPGFLVAGQCRQPILTTTFDAQRFQGVWYKVGGLPTAEEKAVNCTKYDYQQTGSGYRVQATGVDGAGTPVTQTKTLTQTDPTVGEFDAVLTSVEAKVVVLNTDYESYACLVSCYQFQTTHKAQFAWIISRSRTLSKDKIGSCQRSLLAADIPIRKLEKTHQGASCTN